MTFGQKKHFIAKNRFFKCSAFSLQLNAENRFKIRTACNQIHVFQLFFMELLGKFLENCDLRSKKAFYCKKSIF